MLQVVAGDADMDRGDYLMRDAVTTGMQHNYDVWELIRASKVGAALVGAAPATSVSALSPQQCAAQL